MNIRFPHSILSLMAGLGILGTAACSSAPKNRPVLSEMEGKKVALVSIEGSETQKRIIEVALVNQLVRNGSFLLIPREEVDRARTHPAQDPRDIQGIARRSKADYALTAKVAEFLAEEREGYSEEKVEYDSLLAQERGESRASTTRLFKVKSLEGKVKIQLRFIDLDAHQVREGDALAQQTLRSSGKRGAPKLPPKLRFLEKLTQQAFAEFFKNYR